MSTFYPEEVMVTKEKMDKLKEQAVIALTLAKKAWMEAKVVSNLDTNSDRVGIAIIAGKIFDKL